jgi:hypothetical protein
LPQKKQYDNDDTIFSSLHQKLIGRGAAYVAVWSAAVGDAKKRNSRRELKCPLRWLGKERPAGTELIPFFSF